MAVNNLNTPGVGIQPSLIDAKGDLLVGTANDAIDRLGVTGTTGAVLTADAGETTGLKWAAAGSVGGLVHINTTSFSSVSSQTFNDIFSTTYDTYEIYMYFTSPAVGSGGRASIQFTAGGTATTTNYAWQTFFNRINAANSTSTGAVGVSNDSALNPDYFNATNDTNIKRMLIVRPFNATPTSFYSETFGKHVDSGVTYYQNDRTGATQQSNTSFDGFKYASSAAFSGVMQAFGVKK
jgi:hypothetical protein